MDLSSKANKAIALMSCANLAQERRRAREKAAHRYAQFCSAKGHTKKGQQDDKKAFWKRGVRPSGELGGGGTKQACWEHGLTLCRLTRLDILSYFLRRLHICSYVEITKNN